MPFSSKRADLLERSLQGDQVADKEVCDLTSTVGRIPALTSPACAPRPEFVSALGIRLHAEALTLPAREAHTSSSASRARSSALRPMVFVIGRGLPRVLAGATASVLVVGAVVGGASRSALPGGLLYPVKALLDSAAVQLAGSDFDRGTTLLSQAQGHVSDASSLVDRDGTDTDPASVDRALLGAYDAASGGQRALLGEFDRTGNPQALLAIQDFVAHALPQLSALRSLLPADSKPDIDALTALLQSSRASLARKIAVCGQQCTSLGGVDLGTLAPLTGLPAPLPAPGVPAVGVPTLGSTAGVTIGGGAATVDPPIPGSSSSGQGLPTSGDGIPMPTPLTKNSGTINVSPPALPLGPIAVNPSPIVIPPIVIPSIVIPPILYPVPLLTSGLLGLQ